MFSNLAILPESFWSIFTFLIGACFGSFANVAIYRMPVGGSVVKPGSHCLDCKTPVKWYDNIPLLSFWILRGKCRSCGAKFSIRYFFVELITAVLFLLCYLQYGLSWYTLELSIFTVMAVIASGIDLDHMILPDSLTLTGLGLGLIGALVNPERSFWDGLAGALIGGGVLWAVAVAYTMLRKEEGMGGGDIKLLAWIGSLAGSMSIPFIIMTSSIAGTIIGVIVMRSSAKGLKTVIPFGPYLVFGAYVYFFGGDLLAKAYLGLFIPALVE
jgi:leader peptidase (prepilin peptidase)/N-methyltransferase